MAQKTTKSQVFVTNLKEGNKGIAIKWLYSGIYNPDGFDIYRSGKSDNWKKLNTSPIRLNHNASTASFDKETKQMYEAVEGTPYEDFSTNMVRVFVMIKAIYKNDLAESIGILYYDKTATVGSEYKYKVTFTNETDAIGVSKMITKDKFNNSLLPNEVVLNRKKKFISISWKPDVFSYYGVDIYRKEEGELEFKKVTKGPITVNIKKQKNYKPTDVFFLDTLIDNTKSYTYKFISIDYFGQESKLSDGYTAPIKDFTPPSTPYSFRVQPHVLAGFVTLSWEALEEPDLKGFDVYTSPDPDSKFKRITMTPLGKNVRSYDVKGLATGGHYFIIAAIDNADNVTTTGMMFGEMRDITPPVAPKNLTSKAESGTITLKWDKNSEGDLKGYIIQKSLNDSNNLDNHYVNLNAKPILENTYEIKLPVKIKNKFVYRVLALDTLYNISKPSVNSLSQMPDVIAPKKPIISSILTRENDILITWIKNADADLVGYHIYRKEKGDSLFSRLNINKIPPSVIEYKDRNAVPGINYDYVLLAEDNSGNLSEYSDSYSAKLKSEKSNIEIEISKSSYNAKKKATTLIWNMSESLELKGFVVYIMEDSGILKPYTGLINTQELKIKEEITNKKSFEIRAYTESGEVIKSKLITVSNKRK